MAEVKKKKCNKCNAEKTLDDFSKQSDKPDGRKSWCKLCTYNYQVERKRLKNLEIKFEVI